MREIRLSNKQYKIVGDITQRAINPILAKLGATGGLEYSDFSQATHEEYYDFRDGIGKDRGVGSDARLQWSEGIDFTIDGQTVLGNKINTADYTTWVKNTAYITLNFVVPTATHTVCFECTTPGTSHATTEPTWDTTVGNTTADGTVVWTCRAYLAPIKIIDFQSNTYIIQNSRILKWNGTKLICVDKTFASPIDAIVILDGTDEYLIVSSASDAIYTTDGATWIAYPVDWITPTGYVDDETVWTNEANVYDDNTATYASVPQANTNATLQLTLTVPLYTDRIRIYASEQGGVNPDIDIDFYYEAGWHDVYDSTVTKDTWVTITNSAGVKRVEKLRVHFDTITGTTGYIHEVDFGAKFLGYMAGFESKLWCITTDGKGIISSATNDIDDYYDTFDLTGDFGTVYDLFEGKLLSDGSPILYSTGTQGTYTIDTVTELAYEQEVSYPPLTYSGHKGLYWNANVWVTTGYGILKIASSMATEIGPNQDDGLPSGYQGYIYDMVAVNNWLVYCVNGGTTDKSSILKRNLSYGGSLQVYTTSAVNKPIACLWHSPSSLYTNGRLWFGEGTDVKYMMFPDTTSNPKQVATYDYVSASGYGKFPILRKLAIIDKVALGVTAITKSCDIAGDANEYIEVFYGLNGAEPTTSLGVFETSPKPTALSFNSGLGTEFYTIQFATKLYRGTTETASPELESLVFSYYGTPETINAWLFNIDATGDEGDRIFTEFETIRDTKILSAFYPSGDTAKTSYSVKLTAMPSREWWENQGRREGVFQVVCEEIWNG